MKNWVLQLKNAKSKKPMPILSFPAIQLMGIDLKTLISSSEMQAKGMELIAQRTQAAAAVSMMDLSVEAEAFGAQVKFSNDEIPTVSGRLLENVQQVEELKIPSVGAGRTSLYIDAISKAKALIKDRPVLAGVTGPFTLSGMLLDVSKSMLLSRDEPDLVHSLLKKVTQFSIEYIKAYKSAGADGVLIAEPLAGLLTPPMNSEFSVKYLKDIIDAVRDENFVVIYHNCGGGVLSLLDDIFKIGADAYHFGNAIDICQVLKRVKTDTIIMGNIDPVGEFCNGTALSISAATTQLLEKCADHSNFIISSGCDIPSKSKWENIDAFFNAVSDFYKNR